MAKYEDYARNIEGEIEEAGAASDQRARDAATGRYIPERFKGKSLDDVIKSYEELEKLQSRQAQSYGELQKTMSKLLEQQMAQASSPAPEPSKPVSVDDLYDDADGTLRRVAKEEVSGEVQALRKELQELRVERKLAHLDGKFEDWRDKVADPEFNSWVQESPYRQRMYVDADSGDFDAAEEILGMYYDRLTVENEQEKKQQRKKQLQDGMLESSSPQAVTSDDTFSRFDLEQTRIAAKQGDRRAEAWLRAHADSIAIAYEEGRIVD